MAVAGVRTRGWLLVTVGIVAILIGGFLPWLRSGRAWRNSYEVVRTADRLGLVGDGVQRVLAVTWYLVPLLCGLTLAAIALDRHWLSHIGTTIVAGLVAITAVVALRAPLPTGWGPKVAGAGAALAVVGSVVAAADRTVGGRRTSAPTEKFRVPVTRTARRRRPSSR